MKATLLFISLTLIYIIFRLINIKALPLYLDEGNYVWWAKLFTGSDNFAYVSLQDGKTPLFVWLITYFNQYFHDYLLTARVISVAAGGLTLLCWMLLVNWIENIKMALLFWLVVLVTPFDVLITRLGLMDSLMTAFVSLSVLSLTLVKQQLEQKKSWLAVVFGLLGGMSLGLAYLTKTSAKVFLPVFLIIVLIWIGGWLRKGLTQVCWLITSMVVGLIAYYQVIDLIRTGGYRFWAMIQMKEILLTFTPNQVLDRLLWHPDYSLYLSNLPLLGQYGLFYLAGSVLFISVGIYILVCRYPGRYLWLLILAILPVVGIFLSARILASRYFYVAVPALMMISLFGIKQLWGQRVGRMVVVLLLMINLILTVKMQLTPLVAAYSEDDKSYLVESDLTALGASQIVGLLTDPARSIVGISGQWGVAEGAMVILEQSGVKTIKLTNWLEVNDQGGQVKLDGLLKSPQPDRYLYLTEDRGELKLLQSLTKIEIIKTWIRSGSGRQVHLIKLL